MALEECSAAVWCATETRYGGAGLRGWNALNGSLYTDGTGYVGSQSVHCLRIIERGCGCYFWLDVSFSFEKLHILINWVVVFCVSILSMHWL